jgi:hypothetical protein
VNRFVPAVLVAASMLSGCAAISGCTAAPGPDAPVAASATAAPSTGKPKLAPPVPAPRSARGVAACDLLTADQKREAGADLSTETTSTQGQTTRCGWRTTTDDGSLLVSTAPDFPVGGLEGLYLVRSTFSVFQPGELDGFPAVRADRTDTGDKDCTLYIGIADDQLIWSTVRFPFGGRSACDTARRMGSDMIANLPALG